MNKIVHTDTSSVDAAVARDAASQEFETRIKTIMQQVQPVVGKRLIHNAKNWLITQNKGGELDRWAAVTLQVMISANACADWICEAEAVSPIGDPAVDGRALAVERVFIELFRKAIRDRKASRAVASLGTKGNA